MVLHITYVAFILGLISIGQLECRVLKFWKEWIPRPNTNQSYLFCNSTLSWEEARESCQGMDADLVVIRDASEKGWLDQTMVNRSFFHRQWWIGIHDWDLEGNWKWIDGTLINATVTQWREGDPNNGDSGKYCSVITRIIRLKPVPCESAKCFICYNESQQLLTVPNPFFINSRLLEFHSGPVSWKEANETCKKKSWSLVQVHNPEERGSVNTYLSNDESRCSSWWVGLEKGATGWKWLDNKYLDTQALPWESDVVLTENVEEDCGLLSNGQLNDSQCSQPNEYICKKESTIIVPSIITEEVSVMQILQDNYLVITMAAVALILLVLLALMIVKVSYFCFKCRRKSPGPRKNFYKGMTKVEQHIPVGNFTHKANRSHANTGCWVNRHSLPMMDEDNSSGIYESIIYYEDVLNQNANLSHDGYLRPWCEIESHVMLTASPVGSLVQY